MMRPSRDLPEVFLCRDIVDFRKGINGLTVLVEDALGLDPFSERLFIFCNRKKNMIRILYWERNGFCLWQKRLEKEKFKWPHKHESEIITLTGQQINWLLDGYDVMRMQAHQRLNYSTVL
ncbi:Mobile element protein [hydrothermal vent metagenome]|uniref:Mobile element protein n=1 Tax=hydrothermal vent metagenome TaxID=652676 RepID=A0A3B0YL75_9ZZZZ